MATEKQNTTHINTFSKGMDADTTYDSVSAEHYIFGKNVRITNNTLIAEEADANTTEGIVTPVYEGKKMVFEGAPDNIDCILAIKTLDDIGGVVFKYTDGKWGVYRAELIDDKIIFTKIVNSTETTEKNRFSTIINKEIEGVTKLYIADGKHPVMQVRLDSEEQEYYNSLQFSDYTIEDALCQNRIFPYKQITINKQITGRLKTQQVQYTYRLYKKYGVTSTLAPLTHKIQIIDNSRNKEIGNAEDTETSIGLELNISVSDTNFKIFDHIQVFRLSYVKNEDNADINLIYEAKIPSTKNILVSDIGLEPLQHFTYEELSNITGKAIIPQTIEQSQGYIFGGSVIDESSLRLQNIYSKYGVSTRSFSQNADGQYRYYKDPSYEESKGRFTTPLLDLITKKSEEEGYCLNKYADINIGDSVEEIDECSRMTTVDSKTGITSIKIGGNGKNIDWHFIRKAIPIKKTTNPLVGLCSYDDIFVSSLYRSLKRDEVYRYGIVFFTKYGTRSDVLWIADIRTPACGFKEIKNGNYEDFQLLRDNATDQDNIYANSLGIQFDIKLPKIFVEDNQIIGYEIVRCETSDQYQSILMQCVTARPVRQSIGSGRFNDENQPEYTQIPQTTPYYPTGFLFSGSVSIQPGYGLLADGGYYSYAKTDSNTVWQLFSPEITFQRNDSVSRLNSSRNYLQEVGSLATSRAWLYGGKMEVDSFLDRTKYGRYYYRDDYSSMEHLFNPIQLATGNYELVIDRTKYDDNYNNKTTRSYSLYYYNLREIGDAYHKANIKSVSDTKDATWEKGFSNIEVGAENIKSGIKQYKSFITPISDKMFCNWCANGMYDLRVTDEESQPGIKSDNTTTKVFLGIGNKSSYRDAYAAGWVGPGGRCLVAVTDESFNIAEKRYNYPEHATDTTLCNIKHKASQFSGYSDEQRQYDVYYGFGDFYTLEKDGDLYKSTAEVFDGDIYVNLFEIPTMLKAYNFNSMYDSIPSAQIINYVPIESRINTCFDYGMNYRNTGSDNLQLEPGDIEGVSTQERPLNQYNMVYSFNSISNDVYAAQSLESEPVTYKQRIVYSEPKINGSYVDSWGIFKPADYIDADSRYGELTNLYTVQDRLFYWQKTAFGKLSVNERSLVKDENSNTIQLGQGNVLQRVDYLSTKYGMREGDYCAVSSDSGVYWVDIINKAIAVYTKDNVVNYGEYMNTQNILNKNMSDDVPSAQYDVQNNELLFKCLNNGEQIVYNDKFGFATSVYNRSYEDIANFNNVLYGINVEGNTIKDIVKYNYLTKEDVEQSEMLKNQVISFAINTDKQVAKVFDNQKLVTLQRQYSDEFVNDFFKNVTCTFETDLNSSSTSEDNGITDREGNLLYAIPRMNNSEYGDRIRGKWMKVTINNSNPTKDFALSHVITKFRQSLI